MHTYPRFLVLFAFIACAVETAFAQESLRQENPYDFRSHIRDASEWMLANEHRVQLKMEGQNTIIEDGVGNILLELKAPDYLKQVCRARQGGALVLAVWNTDDGRGSDYTGLVLIRADKSGLNVSRVFKSRDDSILKHRWWLSEIGAVSESGDQILAEFGEMPEGSGWVTYRWQTWKVSPPTRLGIGLQIANGQLEEKNGEQGGTGQPATRPESKSVGSDKPQPEAEGRSR